MQDDVLNPLVACQKQLEGKLQEVLDTAAIYRKKIDAVRQAIDVLRSSDADLKTVVVRRNGTRPDPKTLKENVLGYLQSVPSARITDIESHLGESGIRVTRNSIKKVLAIEALQEGSRNNTYYSVLK